MATSLEMAQDAVWCDHCPSNQFLKSPAELHCKPCNTNLCSGCADEHKLSKTSIKHDIVEYNLRNSEPKYPQCQYHREKKCELQCQQCQVPICVQCLNKSHQGHMIAGISGLIDLKRAQIMQDNEELEKTIAPEYEKQDSELETNMSDKSQKYESIIKSIDDHGKGWHKEVDKIVNKHTTDVKKDEREDLGGLQKFQSEIRNTKSLIYQTIEKNKNILKSNDITELANYRSRNDEFKQIPPRTDFSPPSFKPIKIPGNEIFKLFGSLSDSFKSEVKDYTIKMAEEMSDSFRVSLKGLLDQSRVIIKVYSETENLRRICCVENDEIWISGENRKIKRISIRGKLLQKVADVCSITYPNGLSVSRNGTVLYCDRDDRSVKMICDKKIQTVIKLKGWIPRAVCCCSSGDILVLVGKEDDIKLVRYSGSVVKQEIQHNHKGQLLFTLGSSCIRYWIRYIDENRNQDICVQNYQNIVVVNQSGQLRFTYDGKNPANKWVFAPRGIATDSKCQILIADVNNNSVHVIDKDGKFLCFINCNDPGPVSVDSQDRLWVGHFYSGIIKVIQYMK